MCQDLASISWHYRLPPGITSLAEASTSWTSAATGDSGSHRHAALWVLFAALAQGCRGLALLCSRDQSELLCQRDKALLCFKHPCPFSLHHFFVLSVVPQMKTLFAATRGWINGWINGRADGNVDKETNVSSSVDPFGGTSVLLLGCTVLTKKKNHRPIAISFRSILQLRYGLKYNRTVFLSQLLKDAHKMPGCLVWLKWMISPSWKYIVYRPRILHNIKTPCLGRCLKRPSHRKKVQPSAIWNCACSKYCDKLYSSVWSLNNKLTKWGFQARGGDRSSTNVKWCFRNPEKHRWYYSEKETDIMEHPRRNIQYCEIYIKEIVWNGGKCSCGWEDWRHFTSCLYDK